jgi:hypothetical protein
LLFKSRKTTAHVRLTYDINPIIFPPDEAYQNVMYLKICFTRPVLMT